MYIIDPRGMTILDWVDSTMDLLSDILPYYKLDGDEDWIVWGNLVRQSLRRDGILVPDPSSFEDWEEWAIRFNQVLAPVRL